MTTKNVSKKYELTNETTEVKDHLYGRVRTLYRIRALRSFGGVKRRFRGLY